MKLQEEDGVCQNVKIGFSDIHTTKRHLQSSHSGHQFLVCGISNICINLVIEVDSRISKELDQDIGQILTFLNMPEDVGGLRKIKHDNN